MACQEWGKVRQGRSGFCEEFDAHVAAAFGPFVGLFSQDSTASPIEKERPGSADDIGAATYLPATAATTQSNWVHRAASARSKMVRMARRGRAGIWLAGGACVTGSNVRG